MLFRVKICGITNPADARTAAEAGADAIGLNFYPLSPRLVDLRLAEQIVAVLPEGVAKVGVFVNSSSAEVRAIATRLDLDYVQIHGDEPPEFLCELVGLKIIRAFRCGDNLQSVKQSLSHCHNLGCLPEAVLIDAHQVGEYGGTGKAVNWDAIGSARRILGDIPVILAGGLRAANVAEAIAKVRPHAVDTASGVETAPGKKAPQLVEAFVAEARAAFADLPAASA